MKLVKTPYRSKNLCFVTRIVSKEIVFNLVGVCKICEERRIDTALIHCGHVACSICVDDFVKEKNNKLICVVCSQSFETTIDLSL